MNIHEVNSQGQAERIGPFKVNKSYGVKGTGDKSNHFILIEDLSGKGAMKIWGQAGGLLHEGKVYTLTASGQGGSIKVEENQGKSLIVCNGCSVHEDGAGAPASAPAAQEPTVAPQIFQKPPETPNTPGQTTVMLARMAQISAEYRNMLIACGFPEDKAIDIAGKAPEYCALWWFGQKGA